MADSNIYYVGSNTLSLLWQKIKSVFVPQTRKINGYDLTEDRNLVSAVTLSLSPGDWSAYADTFDHVGVYKEVSGVDEDDIVFVCPHPDSQDEWYSINMRCYDQEEGKLYFKTSSSFSNILKCNVLIIKIAGS